MVLPFFQNDVAPKTNLFADSFCDILYLLMSGFRVPFAGVVLVVLLCSRRGEGDGCTWLCGEASQMNGCGFPGVTISQRVGVYVLDVLLKLRRNQPCVADVAR